MKVPVSLIIDDPAPVLSVYYTHHATGFTKDGRPILRNVPVSFLRDFCDVIEKRGIKGKFSVVPMPGNCGDIRTGIEGVSAENLNEWLDLAKTRVAKQFSIGPEMLTHNMAVDLETGAALSMNERDWASTQNRETLTPYIAKAFSILKGVGIESCGVTSPWDFGIEVEDEYAVAISQAAYEVYGAKNAWYFLRGMRNQPNAKPWIAYEEGDRTLVSIPATTNDHIWQTIETTDTSEEFVKKVADELITEDGTSGEWVQVLETGGYPILIAHWQSLVSNGNFTGLRVLDEVARRINERYSDRVEWMDFEEILQLVLKDKDSYRAQPVK